MFALAQFFNYAIKKILHGKIIPAFSYDVRVQKVDPT